FLIPPPPFSLLFPFTTLFRSLVRDQHDLVLGVNQSGSDDLAVALALLDRDHALGAAPVARVFDDRRALAVALLGRREHALLLVLDRKSTRLNSSHLGISYAVF